MSPQNVANINIVLLFLLFSFVHCNKFTCSSQSTCGSCIQTMDCVWCSQSRVTVSPRCLEEDQVTEKWCPQEFIVNPTSRMDIKDNRSIGSSDGKDSAIQISPQRIHLSLRLGKEVKFPLKYQQAVGYPVDLYYLMDLSASMADDKDKLSLLGSKLTSAMKHVTNNFRIGFGSFVDKPEMPYVSTVPSKLAKPCTLPTNKKPCAPPYSFKNQFPLSDDVDQFVNETKNAPVSGNIDFPEGGFDALMQVLVCKEEIGWREKSRKLVIFSTDANFHLAGDGKLAGIVEPNDGLCHLSSDGSYTYALLQDYPSIPMLDMKARENNINIIFAVTKNQEKIYNELKDNIFGASYGTLTKDSSNVVDLVKAEYDKLVDSVSFSDDAGGSIEIKYYSKCLGNEMKQNNECKNLKGRPELDFIISLKAVTCPENKERWSQIVNIKPKGLNESLTLEVDILCRCDCEKNADHAPKSTECNNAGTLQCGICSCDSGLHGKFCECSGSEQKAIDQSACKKDNTTEKVCSGFGVCRCGKCECNARENTEEKIYGTHCECDNFSCTRNEGLVCSGIERGRCECGQCLCESGWSGVACECRETNSTCIAPGSSDICSGHGYCKCGACHCQMNDKFRYSGQYCEECPHCTETKCTQLTDCVECKVHKSGKYAENKECDSKCTFPYEVVDKLDLDEESEKIIEGICKVPDASGCTMVFKYNYEQDNTAFKVYAEKSKQCSEIINVLGVILGVVGSTVIAGLVLIIIWKILTTVHDKREYQKFEKERITAKWDRADNPLYKPSTSLFSNPAYKGQ